MIADEPEEQIQTENSPSVPARHKKCVNASGGADGKPVGGKVQGAQ